MISVEPILAIAITIVSRRIIDFLQQMGRDFFGVMVTNGEEWVIRYQSSPFEFGIDVAIILQGNYQKVQNFEE